MTPSFNLDTRQFTAALRDYRRATKKDCTVIINKAALQTIIGAKGVQGAIQRTPRAAKARIKAVNVKDVARVVMARARKKGEHLTAIERNKRIKAEYNRRVRSSGYTAGPGWDKAARALGGRGVRRQEGFERSGAAHGTATKATDNRLVAVIQNTAPAAEKIGLKPLQAALNDVARDMANYAREKMSKTAKQFSGRK